MREVVYIWYNKREYFSDNILVKNSKTRNLLKPWDKETILGLHQDVVSTSSGIAIDISTCLETLHPMTRVIRSEIDGGISAFLLIEEGETEKELSIVSLYSDGRCLEFFSKEVQKLITKAQKQNYKIITYHWGNTRINNILEKRYDFIADDTWKYTKDISTDLSRAINYLQTDRNASQVWKSLSPKEQNHITWLLKKAHDQKTPLQEFRLYGAIQNLKKQFVDLESISSLTSLLKRSYNINIQNDRDNTLQQYFEDFQSFLHIHCNAKLQIQQKQELKDILREPWRWWLSNAIKQFLTKHQIPLSVEYQNQEFGKTFLSWLSTKEPTKLIASLDSKEFPYDIVSLQNKAELKKESSVLWHCIGNSDYYMEKIRHGEILALSLRDDTWKPYWTIEYNIQKKSIEQFKWWWDVSVNSLPENRELLFSTLKALDKNNYEVNSISENFDYSIIHTGKTYESTSEESKLREFSRDKESTVLKWELTLDNTYSLQEIQELCKEPGLTLDMTDVSAEFKDKITTIAGNITDNSFGDISYSQLQSNGWGFYARNAASIHLPQLQYNRGDFDVESTISIHLPQLQYNGGYFDAGNANSIHLPKLQSNRGDFYAGNATSIHLPKLQSNRGDFYAGDATSIHLPQLQYNRGDFYARNATSIHLPELQYNGGYFDAGNANSIHLPKLQSNGWGFYARNTTSIHLPLDVMINNQTLQEYNSELYEKVLQSKEGKNR